MVAAKWETRQQQQREDAILDAVKAMIVNPWWGTHTELLTIIRSHIPPHVWFKPCTPRSLSAVLSEVAQQGRLDGWGVYRWRSSEARMISLIPPGWVWDGLGRRWLLHGVPV